MEAGIRALRLPGSPLRGIKLVVCDMDGTALNEKKEFSPATLKAFAALRERGIAYTIASARTPMMLELYLKQAKISGVPLIALEGAVVIDPKSKELLYDCPLDEREAVEICTYCHDAYLDYTIYTSLSCYMRRDTHRMWRFDLYNRLAAEHGVEPVPTAVYEEATPELIAGERVYKIFVDNPDDASRMALEEFLPDYGGVRTDCSERRSVSIMRREVSKAAALERICAILGLKREEICCFGDWNNDVAMLAAFPHSVAMLNGTAEAREAARYVTAPNVEDGVARFIEDYILR